MVAGDQRGLATPGVAVVAAACDVLDAVPKAIDLLTDAERARAALLREAVDRMSYVAAHTLVRLCRAQVCETTLATPLVQRCDRCGGPHGRPRIPGDPTVGLSLSRSGGVVAAAVAPTSIGIDVELLASADRVAGVAHRFCTDAERLAMAGAADEKLGLLMLWVRKEALVKLGLATLDSMSRLDLSRLPVDLSKTCRRLGWKGLSMVDLTLGAPAAVAAVVGTGDIEVRPLSWLLPGLSRRC